MISEEFTTSRFLPLRLVLESYPFLSDKYASYWYMILCYFCLFVLNNIYCISVIFNIHSQALSVFVCVFLCVCMRVLLRVKLSYLLLCPLLRNVFGLDFLLFRPKTLIQIGNINIDVIKNQKFFVLRCKLSTYFNAT